MAPDANFEVAVSPDIEPAQTLLVGLSSPGMGGLTAADYMIRQYEAEELGHISPEELPAITPIEDGKPRHHTRLYNLKPVDFTVLVSELFVPVWAARSFAEMLLEWVEHVQIEEIVILHAVPFPHQSHEHAIFHVATEGFHDLRLEDAPTKELKGGYLDGIPGELLSHSMDGEAPPVGVLVTPGHPPGPDVDAALNFLDAIEKVYDVSIDMQELEDLSDSIQKHYAALAERLQELQQADDSYANREFTEDRMFM